MKERLGSSGHARKDSESKLLKLHLPQSYIVISGLEWNRLGLGGSSNVAFFMRSIVFESRKECGSVNYTN